jgi:hypothetical protein
MRFFLHRNHYLLRKTPRSIEMACSYHFPLAELLGRHYRPGTYPHVCYLSKGCLFLYNPQIFFAGRVYKFSRSMIIPIISWTLCLVRFAINLASTILGFQSSSLELFMSQYSWMFSVILTTSAVIDLMLAIALSYSLSQHKEKGMPAGYVALPYFF